MLREEPLSGGNVTTGVVRVGDTVRRPTGPWTPSVHALLRHLEQKGFEGAPRVLGIDEQGREVLTFIHGPVAWPWHATGPLRTDDGLRKAAEIVRDYHDVVATFVPPKDAVWNKLATDGGDELICHNDLAFWNLILEPNGRWAFIDWDFAAPGTRLHDLAKAARNFVPLFPDTEPDWPYVRRLAVLCDVWRTDPAALIEAVVARDAHEGEWFRARAMAGEQPWHDMWHSGHGEGKQRITAFIGANAESWIAELS